MKLFICTISLLLVFGAFPVKAQVENELNDQLIIAADEGDTASLQMLIRRGADVNATTFEGVTPLMFGVQNGNAGIVRLLIQQGARPDRMAVDGNTALILAIMNGNFDITEYLILKGADINLADKNGKSPLMYAIEADSFYLPDMILYYGTNPGQKDNTGKNALMLASAYGSYEIAVKLLEAGIEINGKDNRGNTALHYAASEGKDEIMDLLVINGASLEIKNDAGYTPLSVSVARNHYKATRLLIGYGADVNTRISNALNPLTLAVSNKNDSLKSLLLNNNAELIKRPNFNKTILGMKSNFNEHDAQLFVMVGFNDDRWNLMPTGGFGLRPGSIRVLEGSGQSSQYQYWESRYFVFLSLDKAFLVQNLNRNVKTAAFAGLSGVFTLGAYKGTSANPDARMVFNPRLGCMGEFGNLRVKVSYEYMNLKLISYTNYWVSVSLEFLVAGKRKLSMP